MFIAVGSTYVAATVRGVNPAYMPPLPAPTPTEPDRPRGAPERHPPRPRPRQARSRVALRAAVGLDLEHEPRRRLQRGVGREQRALRAVRPVFLRAVECAGTHRDAGRGEQ